MSLSLKPHKKKKIEKFSEQGSFQISSIFCVGVFLAWRDILRANIWTTLLIIFVMAITFLNLVVVSGVLIGLVEGAVIAQKEHYTGDLIISHLPEKNYIEDTQNFLGYLRSLPEVKDVSARFIQGGAIEANYKNKEKSTDITDSARALIAGIDPYNENAVTGLSRTVIAGEYLSESDFGKILIGADLLYSYTPIDTPSMRTLPNVLVGTKVRLLVNGFVREVEVKGILKSKVGEVDGRVFMIDPEVRGLIGRTDFNADEIVVKTFPGTDPLHVKEHLLRADFGKLAKIQTSTEAQPKFLQDMKTTFGVLGNLIGTVGLIVASITIFIIIFVNAITRRKSIGILKGIGINSKAIELSYVLQAVFYGIFGSVFGLLIIYVFLKPYFDANPINFPFSDGILVVTPEGAGFRVFVLMFATMIAGYVPAKIVVKQNTLDAILGR